MKINGRENVNSRRHPSRKEQLLVFGQQYPLALHNDVLRNLQKLQMKRNIKTKQSKLGC